VQIVRFGVFEADFETGELRNERGQGAPTRQPFRSSPSWWNIPAAGNPGMILARRSGRDLCRF